MEKNKQGVKRFLTGYLLPWLLSTTLLLVLLDYTVCHFVLSKDVDMGAAKMYRFFYHPDSYKIPIIGSSRGRCSYIPEILGEGYYNFANDGSSIVVHSILADYAAKSGKYKYIIINLDPNVWLGIGDWKNYLPVLNYPDFRQQMMANFPAEEFPVWQTVNGIRFSFFFEDLMKAYLQTNIDFGTKTKLGYTYYFNKLQTDTALFARYFKAAKKGGELPQFEAKLRNVLHKYPKQKFVLVFAPIFQPNNKDSLAIDNKRIEKRINSFAGQNVRIISFQYQRNEMKYFADPEHLNIKGAEIFSKSLADSLKHYRIKP